MSSHAVFCGPTCRVRTARPAQRTARSSSFFGTAAAPSSKLRPLRPLRAAEVQASDAETSTSEARPPAEAAANGGGNGKLMPMADSLVERAKEVASTGTVDEAFKESFVPELQAELGVLTERAHQAEAQAAAMEEALKTAKDQLLRLNADFDNFRKRTATERDQLKATVKGDTIKQLVPLIDNFELAKQQIKAETEGEQRVDAAYQGLYRQMVEIFRGMGVEAVPGVGEPFDPNVHDAIMREPNEEVPDGTVLEEFRKGFRLGETLLRPAMVKVSYSDAPAPAISESSEGESSE